MPPVPLDAFTREFRRLSPGDRAGFVAAVWAARGWETTVDGDVVVADRGEDRRRIRVVAPGWFGTPDLDDVDVLVVARDRKGVRSVASEAGVEYVPPEILRDLVLYGIDRNRARTLYGEWFDRPLTRTAPEPETEERAFDWFWAALPSLTGNRRAVGTLLFVVLVGIAVAGPALPGGSAPDQSPVTAADVTPADEPGGAVGAASPTPTERSGLPSGVTRAGVVDPTTLVAAHTAGVRNRSRVRSVTMTGSPNTSTMGGTVARNMTTRIVNESHYRHRAESRFAGEESTNQLGVYADGDGVYQRVEIGNETRYSRYTVDERPATGYDDLTSSLYRYFVGAEDTVVRCAIAYDTDCPTYRIEIDGEAPGALEGEAEDYEALAIVSDEGVVTTIRASYTLPDANDDGEREPVRFALDYQFETVELESPTWLDDARNATANESTTAEKTSTPTGETETPTSETATASTETATPANETATPTATTETPGA